MKKIIELILQQPDVLKVLELARAAYEQEQRDRAAFIEWLTPSVKAEFILGEIVVHSPAKRGHYFATGNAFKLLSAFVDKHKLGQVSVEKALVRLGRNDFEPDVCFW